GEDNERTQRKADILQEVLERYEARVERVAEHATSKQAKGRAPASSKAAAKTGAGKSVKAEASRKKADLGKTAKAKLAPVDKVSSNTPAKTTQATKARGNAKAGKADKKAANAEKTSVS